MSDQEQTKRPTKRPIYSLDVYDNSIKLGTLSYIDLDPEESARIFGDIAYVTPPKGYYQFSYENPDSLHEMFQLSVNGLYPVRAEPFYFLDQEVFEAMSESIDVTGRQQINTIHRDKKRFMMFPSVFYNAIPQGLLYESIVKSPEFSDIDFSHNMLGILSVTGANPIGRIHCVETGSALEQNPYREVDVGSVDRFLMQYYDPDKPSLVNVGALVNVLQNFSRQSGVPGQMPKIMAAINSKTLDSQPLPDHGESLNTYSHYSEYVEAHNNKIAQQKELDDANIDTLNQRMTGANAICILKTEKSAVPGVSLNEFICMNGLAFTGTPTAITQLSGGGKILISVRFDNRIELGISGYNRGFEDMASVMGRSVTNKGMGFPIHIGEAVREDPVTGEARIVNLMKTTVSIIDVYKAMEKVISPGNYNNAREQLFYSFAFSNFVRNSDNHLRNYGILCEEGDVYLAPSYDIFNTDIYLNSPAHGTLAGVRNVTETKTESLSWLDAAELIKVGAKMSLGANKVKQINNNIRQSLELVVGEFIENEAIAPKIYSESRNSAVMVAMTRSFEDSIRTIFRDPSYTLNPGPSLERHYQQYLSDLTAMTNEQLAAEYDERLIHFKPGYLKEIASLLVEREILPGVALWGKHTGSFDDIPPQALVDAAESRRMLERIEREDNQRRERDAAYLDMVNNMLNINPERPKSAVKPGFDIPDDNWEEPALKQRVYFDLTGVAREEPDVDPPPAMSNRI